MEMGTTLGVVAISRLRGRISEVEVKSRLAKVGRF